MKYKKIIFLGLTYKENVGDIRNSPSISLIKNFKNNTSKKIYVSDPWLKSSPNAINQAKFVESDYINMSHFDVVFLSVAHDEFKIIYPIKITYL